MIINNVMLNRSSTVALAGNVLQISEGTNSVGFCGGIWAFAYVLLCVRLIFLC